MSQHSRSGEWGNIRTTVIDGKIKKVKADGEISRERERERVYVNAVR